MSQSFVYMTCATEKEAQSIGASLVEQRLAACVNILPGMKSMYWWDGEVQSSEEVVLVAKTKASLVDALTQSVKDMHEYEVPCIASMEITGGNEEFLQWIHDETR